MDRFLDTKSIEVRKVTAVVEDISIPFKRLIEINEQFPNKPILAGVEVQHEEEEYPDLEWLLTEIEDGKIIKSDRYTQEDIEREGLEKVQKWADEDRERYEEHGETWQSICVQAVGILKVPMNTMPTQSFTQQEIKSFGLWGVEDDAPTKDIEQEQVSDLFTTLEMMGAIIPEEIQEWKKLFLGEGA